MSKEQNLKTRLDNASCGGWYQNFKRNLPSRYILSSWLPTRVPHSTFPACLEQTPVTSSKHTIEKGYPQDSKSYSMLQLCSKQVVPSLVHSCGLRVILHFLDQLSRRFCHPNTKLYLVLQPQNHYDDHVYTSLITLEVLWSSIRSQLLEEPPALSRSTKL